MTIFIRAVLLGCLFGCSEGAKSGWSYDDISDWSNSYPNCKGNKQSPINIVKSDIQYNLSLANSLSFSNYNSAGSGNMFVVENNGHSLHVDVASVGASITLAGLGSFHLAQFHFHWGSDDGKGSEHQIDGESYPAELHLVHFKDSYSSVTDAKDKTGGLAVIGILIQKGEENAAFKKFLDLYKHNVTESGTNKSVDAFKIDDLLPAEKSMFYRYQGSLTTPTCDQTVTWTMFADQIQISEEQLKEFRELESHGKPLVINYRPVQKLNGRIVSSNFEISSGGLIKTSLFNISLFTFFILAFF